MIASTAESTVPTTFIMSMGGPAVSIRLAPHKPVTFDVQASGVRDLNSYAYLLQARSTEGFTAHLRDAGSSDLRNLGVLMRFRAVPKQAAR